MKALHLLAVSAAMSALPIYAAAEAGAQQRPGVFGPRTPPTRHHGHFDGGGKHGFHGGFFPVLVVEREVPVIVEREVVREVPVTPPPTPPHEGEGRKRKPYVVGSTYGSLPGGCMKMIDEGVSYYFCGGGEWYRQLGGGRDARYRAVAKP